MKNLDRAVEMIGGDNRIRVLKQSQTYETSPIGLAEQPVFLNRVIEIASELMPCGLLKVFRRFEDELGRQRDTENGPRTLDLDLLLYHNWIQYSHSLQLPHPRMVERRFVLVPLVEIAGELRNPHSGNSLSACLDALESKGQEVEIFRG